MFDDVDRDLINEKYYVDDRDFQSKFLLNPNINGYNHFDHNISVTRLSRRFKEPEMVRAVLKAIHVLTKPQYFSKKIVKIKRENPDTGEEEVVDMLINESLFPKTHYHKLGTYHGIIQTSSAADGHLIRAVNTKTVTKEESIEDKTTIKKGFFGKSTPPPRNTYGGY